MKIYILLIVVFAVQLNSVLGLSCPSECNCFGFNGEWIADCARKQLRSVSYSNFDLATTEIHLQYNFIEVLDAMTFSKVPNLKHLYLQSNSIRELPDTLFDNLPELETLRLNGNMIADIGSQKFENLKKLKLLYVHNNELTSISANAFSGLDVVEQISVAANAHLSDINVNAFVGLDNLTMVDMSGSALTTLNPLMVSRITKLNKVYTYDINTLICDNNLQNYLRWMLLNPSVAFGRATMVCAEPQNLKGRSVIAVDPDRHYTVNGQCPVECTCFYSGASFIADCSNRELTSVPAGFGPDTTEIFLQNNNLTSLGAYDFLHLTKLEYLYVHNNFISLVDLNAFTGPALTLKQITLNHNRIGSVTGVFNNMISLQVLNLNDNQLTTIRTNEFSSMINLAQFSANSNNLRMIMPGSFDDWRNLKYLGLADNNLDQIPDNLLDNSANVYFVDISRNSFVSLPVIPSSVSIFEIRECKLLSLSPSSFRAGMNLQTLDLSYNNIYRIEEGTFIEATKLQTLDLTGNKLEMISDTNFANLRNLVVLDLSYNSALKAVSDEAFVSVSGSLQRLYMNNCGFTTMRPTPLRVLQHPNFYGTLSKNPWNCDCELEDFSDFMATQKSRFDGPECQSPPGEFGNFLGDVDYSYQCSDVIPSDAPVALPSDDDAALIISLTIVGALLVFFIATGIIISRSSSKDFDLPDSVNEDIDHKPSPHMNKGYDSDDGGSAQL